MKELLIITDLGCVKGYVVRQDLGDASPTIDLLREEILNRDYVRFADRDSDMAGRFEGGAAIGQQTGMSYGAIPCHSGGAKNYRSIFGLDPNAGRSLKVDQFTVSREGYRNGRYF